MFLASVSTRVLYAVKVNPFVEKGVIGALFLVFTTLAGPPLLVPVANKIAPSTLPGMSFSFSYRHTTCQALSSVGLLFRIAKVASNFGMLIADALYVSSISHSRAFVSKRFSSSCSTVSFSSWARADPEKHAKAKKSANARKSAMAAVEVRSVHKKKHSSFRTPLQWSAPPGSRFSLSPTWRCEAPAESSSSTRASTVSSPPRGLHGGPTLQQVLALPSPSLPLVVTDALVSPMQCATETFLEMFGRD